MKVAPCLFLVDTRIHQRSLFLLDGVGVLAPSDLCDATLTARPVFSRDIGKTVSTPHAIGGDAAPGRGRSPVSQPSACSPSAPTLALQVWVRVGHTFFVVLAGVE